MRLLWLVGFVLTVCFAPAQVVAQEPANEESADASTFYDAALKAFDAEDYEKALFELDRAWMLEKNYVFLYQRILVLEAMGRQQMALELLRNHREAFLETTEIKDLFVVEERLTRARDAAEPDPSPEPASPSRSTLNWVGPIALGVVGVGLTVWGVTLFGESCDLESASGECLQGNEADTPFAATVTGLGATALVGAVLWFVLTRPEATPPAGRAASRFVFSPGGFGVSF